MVSSIPPPVSPSIHDTGTVRHNSHPYTTYHHCDALVRTTNERSDFGAIKPIEAMRSREKKGNVFTGRAILQDIGSRDN